MSKKRKSMQQVETLTNMEQLQEIDILTHQRALTSDPNKLLRKVNTQNKAFNNKDSFSFNHEQELMTFGKPPSAPSLKDSHSNLMLYKRSIEGRIYIVTDSFKG